MSFQIFVHCARPATKERRTLPVRSQLQSGCYPRFEEPDRMNSAPCSIVCRRSSARPRVVTDVFTRAQRSAVMARVRGRGNASTELRTIGLLRAAGITGWRRKSRIFGKPDFVFQKARVAVFVDGCFWHGCPRCKRVPTSSVSFWRTKIQGNIKRDKKVSCQLRKEGWKVVRVRECRLSTPTRFLNHLKTLCVPQ